MHVFRTTFLFRSLHNRTENEIMQLNSNERNGDVTPTWNITNINKYEHKTVDIAYAIEYVHRHPLSQRHDSTVAVTVQCSFIIFACALLINPVISWMKWRNYACSTLPPIGNINQARCTILNTKLYRFLNHFLPIALTLFLLIQSTYLTRNWGNAMEMT